MSIQGGDILWRITADGAQLVSGLKGASSSIKSFADSAARHAQTIGIGMTAMGATITGALGFCVKAFSESEQASTQLEAVLKSTGGAAGLTADELKKLASGFQETTSYEDDAVIAAEALMLTFTNVGKDVFPQAMESVLDLSTAMGGDLQGATIQLGKALNDPIRGITALTRVGVSFTEEQKEQIKVLVESGHTMEAQKMILAELAKEFGGSATAQAKTFAGQLSQLKNQLGDMAENIGGALVPVLSSVVGYVKPIVSVVGDWITANPELVAALVTAAGAAGVLAAGLGPLLIALPVIVGGFAALLSPIGAVAALIGGVLVAGLVAFESWVKEHWETISATIQKGFQFVKTAVSELIEWVHAAAEGITNQWGRVSDVFSFFGDLVWQIASDFGSALGQMYQWAKDNWDSISRVFWSGVDIIKQVLTIAGNIIGAAWELISANVGGFLKGIGVNFDDLSVSLSTGAESISSVLETVNEYVVRFREFLNEHWGDMSKGAEQLASDLIYVFGTIIEWGSKVIDVVATLVGWLVEAGSYVGDALGWLVFGEAEGRSKGGYVAKGRTYRVGERGAEIMFPMDGDNPYIVGAGGTQRWKPSESGWILNHEGVGELLDAMPRGPFGQRQENERYWSAGILNALIGNRIPGSFYPFVWDNNVWMKGLLRIADARATGGNVYANSPYIVGERGRELFIPNQNGYIVPNNRLGGGGVNVTINANTLNMRNADDADALSRELANKVQLRLAAIGWA
jgi:TP901 family phage tail tape measure protein